MAARAAVSPVLQDLRRACRERKKARRSPLRLPPRSGLSTLVHAVRGIVTTRLVSPLVLAGRGGCMIRSLFPSLGLGQLVTRCGLAYVRMDACVLRVLEHSRTAVQAFLWESASPSERATFALHIYGSQKTYGPAGLYPWERSWYERDLPPTPARVLVGGCGAGREMLALLQSGYDVSGFEPTASLCHSARRSLPSPAKVWQLRYEDLTHTTARCRELMADGPYAAVILGWGSFSHVLERGMRERVVQVLARLCPAGPILLSVHRARPNAFVKRPSRLDRGARRAGRTVGKLRGLPEPIGQADILLPRAGFVHQFAEAELEALARSIARTVRWGDDLAAYCHVTWALESQGGHSTPSCSASSRARTPGAGR
jgi:hypothetical protein